MKRSEQLLFDEIEAASDGRARMERVRGMRVDELGQKASPTRNQALGLSQTNLRCFLDIQRDRAALLPSALFKGRYRAGARWGPNRLSTAIFVAGSKAESNPSQLLGRGGSLVLLDIFRSF